MSPKGLSLATAMVFGSGQPSDSKAGPSLYTQACANDIAIVTREKVFETLCELTDADGALAIVER